MGIGWARRISGGALLATAITFGPAGRAGAVGETVNVSPDADLPSTANVSISGFGFTPNSTAYVYQCGKTNDSCTLDPIIPAIALDSSGNFGTRAATVHKTFVDESGNTVTCGSNCRIVVWDNLNRSGEHALAFTK